MDEVRMDEEQRVAHYKNLMSKHYDALVKPRLFNIGDLVLEKVSLATKDPTYGNLGPNWEGPYRVINSKRRSSYYLEVLDGRKLEHPWNLEHLRSTTSKEDSLRRLALTSLKIASRLFMLSFSTYVFNSIICFLAFEFPKKN